MSTPDKPVTNDKPPEPQANATVSPELGAQLLATKDAMQILQTQAQVNDNNQGKGTTATGAPSEMVTPDKTTSGALDLTDPYGNVTVLKPDGTGSITNAAGKNEANFSWKKLDANSVELDYTTNDKAVFHSDGSFQNMNSDGTKWSTDAKGNETPDPNNPSTELFRTKFSQPKENKEGVTEISDGKNKFEFNKDGTGSIKGNKGSDFTYTVDADGGYHLTMKDQSNLLGIHLDLKNGFEQFSVRPQTLEFTIPERGS